MAFDILALIIISVSILLASIRGFSREISSILAFIIALICVSLSLRYGRHILIDYIHPAWLSDTILIIISFLAGYMIPLFFFCKWRKILISEKNGKTPFLDHFLGAIFGLIRGILIAALLLILIRSTLSPDVQKKYLANSFVYPYILKISEIITGYTPKVKEILKEVAPWE